MVTGYDVAVDILDRRDGGFSNAVSAAGPIPPLPFAAEGDDIGTLLDAHREDRPWFAHLVTFGGERHASHRALVTRLLSHDRLRRDGDYLRGIADRLIDAFVARGGCGIVGDYANAVSTLAIADMLGVPEEDRDS